MTTRFTLFFLMWIMLIAFALLTNGCATTPPCNCEEKVRFVDIETYKTWGTTKLTPIGVRPLPTQEEIDNNPMWNTRTPGDYRHERLRKNGFKNE